MKRELVRRGVPEQRIYCDYAGLRTLDSVVRAKEVFGQQHVTIVSQESHNHEPSICDTSWRGCNRIQRGGRAGVTGLRIVFGNTGTGQDSDGHRAGIETQIHRRRGDWTGTANLSHDFRSRIGPMNRQRPVAQPSGCGRWDTTRGWKNRQPGRSRHHPVGLTGS